MKERFLTKVYYEDTDAMGVVYHANYLRFLERARSELFAREIAPIDELQSRGSSLMVHRIEMDLKAPARVGDQLEVVTRPEMLSRYKLVFHQRIERPDDGELLVEALIGVVNVNPRGKLQVLPPEVRGRLEEQRRSR